MYTPFLRVAGPGIEVMSGFLFKNDHADLMLVFVRIFGTMVSYLSGAAGGIFSPSLAIGGTIGSYLTEFFGADHHHLMVLLGMIGFLTGVTRTPFTSFILVLEMTDRHLAVFPMMLAAVAAQWAGSLIEDRSFYENVKLNYLPRRPVSVNIT
jgi:H+/Cl- antiporter ClcA